MLEKMASFFESRLNNYDAHMLNSIEGANEFYPFTASCLPVGENISVLDLGCGTGLELEWYFSLEPTAKVTGVDLAEGMLTQMLKKFPDRAVKVICDSYFDVSFGNSVYDAAVSVESLHHFTKDEKVPLYAKLCKSLKDDGYFVLTDYFSLSDEEELFHQKELIRLKKENGIIDSVFYHFDTPLTVVHEIEALFEGGFKKVEVLKNWGATYTIKASKTDNDG